MNLDELPSSPSALRNRPHLLEVLRRVLPETGLVLEIASGTGEHATWFAPQLPGLRWQPTDRDPQAREIIAARIARSGVAGVAPPLALDAAAAEWPVARADAILCCNMIHISPWASAQGLMAGAGRILAPGGVLALYGPFRVGGWMTGSNERFDASLKRRDPSWGVRDLEVVQALAAGAGLALEERVEMPANNLTLIFTRTDRL